MLGQQLFGQNSRCAPVFDISDGFAHGGMSFEPELVYERQSQGGWRYNASIGAIVADRKLASTFYEVSGAEATLSRPAYTAQSGLVGRVGASVSRSLTPDWRLFGFARIDSVAGSANGDRPLVRQTTGATVGVGGVLHLDAVQRARQTRGKSYSVFRA